ncbi:hypothetical protein Gotur_027482 [Gossypium turneri]
MARDLICLDHKHISVEQMRMYVDQVLQCYIRNISGPPPSLIENYMREAGFWHLATIGRGRTRSIFHAKKCTITLEDMQLQLGLPVDGSALIESVQSADWGAVCYDLLGVILNNIYEG